MLCLHCTHSFPIVPVLCTWKGLILPLVGYWMGGCRRLWCCHREGHAPLLSEWVMQQPLPWKAKKMFQVDVSKCYLGSVLSVGGWRWWLVAFAFRNIWQVLSVELDLCGCYIKVFFYMKPEKWCFLGLLMWLNNHHWRVRSCKLIRYYVID